MPPAVMTQRHILVLIHDALLPAQVVTLHNITAEQRAQIDEENKLDLELYRVAQARFRTQWTSFLGTPLPPAPRRLDCPRDRQCFGTREAIGKPASRKKHKASVGSARPWTEETVCWRRCRV